MVVVGLTSPRDDVVSATEASAEELAWSTTELLKGVAAASVEDAATADEISVLVIRV